MSVMRGDVAPGSGWDAVTSRLAAAVTALPARAAPAAYMTWPSAARPAPYGPGTELSVQDGEAGRVILKLTRPHNRWLLHALQQDGVPDRTFIHGQGFAGSADCRPPVPPDAALLCDRLVTAHAAARTAGHRAAAELAAAGTSPRLAPVTCGSWRGERLTLDVPGGHAEFTYACGLWTFTAGPAGTAGPAPLDPWDDVAGGFIILEGKTAGALLGHTLTVLRARRGPARLGAPEL